MPATSLERSHDELRAALILAGRHIRKTRAVGSAPVLALLRRVLTDARKARKQNG